MATTATTATGSILLAIRIGEASVAPVRTAAWLANGLGSTLTVLHVAVELDTASTVAVSAGLDEEAVRKQMRADARDRAGIFVREILGEVPFEVVVGEGEVAEEVIAVAERIGAALIVTGPQGRGAVSAIILGDTTSDILRHAPCPVVVVPPEE